MTRPSGPLDGPSKYLEEVLAFQAAHGGPFPRSRELEYAVRRVARAWVRAEVPLRWLRAWLAAVAAGALSERAATAALTREIHAWATDECLGVAAVPPARPTGPARAA
ncbi:MAG TPA: hypothetical protein VM076_14915 [Gemmatimonadaceae bacterium]|nr:hypothetical protein [Gemmatimonadaceae bacterium]